MAAPDSLADHPVTVLSKQTIQCANEESLATVPSPFKLGPLDQLVPPSVPIAVVYVYKSGIATERLQRALARLLDYYPHLTGRLQINEKDGVREMIALGTGAELLVAECSSRLDAFSSPVDLPGGGNALCAPFDPTLEGICRDSQFTVQHTRFACGGVALGVRLHHMLCDSDGFFQLVRDLAEIYRSIGSNSSPGALAHPPCIRAYLSELLYDMPQEDRKAALEFKPTLFHAEPATAVDAAPASAADGPAPPPVVGRVIRFSGAELDALKAHATDPNGGSWVSTFDALAAHLWQRLYRARLQLRTAEGVSVSTAAEKLSRAFLTSVNYRARLDAPPRHFGNCLFTPFTSASHEALADAPLWQAARTMHDLTRSMDAKEAEQTVRWIAAQPDKRRIKWAFPGGQGSFMFSAWNKFDMYRGTGFETDASGVPVPPVLVTQPFTPINSIDGLAYTLPTEAQGRRGAPQSGGSSSPDVDLYLALTEPLWPILDRDEQFRLFR